MVLLAAAFAVSGGVAATHIDYVVPPGQEETLARMLGRGVELPGGCRLAGVGADGPTVTAEYACGGDKFVFELRHPDGAPPGAARTQQFALISRSASVPVALRDALVALVRSNEAGFHWTPLVTAPVRQAEPRFASIGIVRVAAVAAAMSAIVAIGLIMQLLLRRLLPPASARPPAAPASFVIAVLTGALLYALLYAALHATGTLLVGLMWNRPSVDLLGSVGRLAVLIPMIMVATTGIAWVAPRWTLRACVGATVIMCTVVGYRISLLPQDLHYFGTLSTFPPNMVSAPGETADPAAVVYETNALGFRAPSFAAAKTEGVIRVALIGDSFVYGAGINEDATLRARLAEELARRWPGRRFEVLNLGMPGNNLASHIELFATATAQLDIDVAVLCLTLPNDLSRWDEQVERQDARQISLFSVVRFLTGDAAGWLWGALRLETAYTPAGLAHLDMQFASLRAMRQRLTRPPVVLLFAFHEWNPDVIAQAKGVPRVAIVPDGLTGADDFIPGDGHPTGIGNTRSAARIAATLADDPAWTALLNSVPR